MQHVLDQLLITFNITFSINNLFFQILIKLIKKY